MNKKSKETRTSTMRARADGKALILARRPNSSLMKLSTSRGEFEAVRRLSYDEFSCAHTVTPAILNNREVIIVWIMSQTVRFFF